MGKLTTVDHSRDVAGLKYIYPVMSRRAGGLSIGINFNTNNACNWCCVYCQVPNLVRGSAPNFDYSLLKKELVFFLNDVLNGSFYDRFEVPLENRVIKDFAISGNGEPTSVEGFDIAVSLIGETVEKSNIIDPYQFVLITNGSLIHKKQVQKGLAELNQFQGQVWFKLDSATQSGRKSINDAGISHEKYIENLLLSASLCPTWLQTCLLKIDGQSLGVKEQMAYLKLLENILKQVDLQGVMLYTLARPSMQPEAERLSKVSEQELNDFAEKIRFLGLDVRVSD
jgi:wyosine [tRNA(Phe)-imidazoG37] synthetase (radical SAM superfamily)